MSVLEIIRKQVDAPVLPDQSLKSLGIDSLDYLSLIVLLEEATEIDVPRETETQFQTVGDLVAFFS